MTQQYLEVLYDPDAFFERGEEAGSVVVPVLAALIVGGLTAFAVLLSSQKTAELVSRMDVAGAEQAQSMMGIAAAIQMGVMLVAPFVGWLIYAGAFHGISGLLDGEGEFATTAVFVGWGLLPSVLGAVVNTVATWLVLRSVELPSGEIDRAALKAFQRSIKTAPPRVVAALFGIVMLLWSAYIWVSAVEHARDVDRQDAMIAVGVPVAIVLLFRLWTNFSVFL